MTEGKWELPEDRVKRIEELQKEIAELEKPDNGEMKDLPLKTITDKVIDVDAKRVENTEFDQYRERASKVLEAVSSAFRSGRMMVVVFDYEGDQIRLSRHTHGFNPDDFDLVCTMLRRDLLGETPQTVKPLPRAVVKRPKPAEVLFGKTQEDKDDDK